ncbi:MAG: PglZ domain-containing protein [Bacteroidales bacterium]|nr:PglZ domain-containing protein [Bacteroidales bacterium]MCB9012705.1 PglZ domain-containing protein [Bacteroidales bacterium]
MDKVIKILWVDDEIDLLKPYILFLKGKGFLVETAHNGDDGISMVEEQDFDLIFLDENMPGLSGLETLSRIKMIRSAVPVVMITKSEAEDIMEEAIGSKIADYLIKPVNPNQILLSIKKNIDTKRLVSEKTTSVYQTQFSQISVKINSARTYEDWVEIYRLLCYWELELDQSSHDGMDEVLLMQKSEANLGWARFIKANYKSWFDPKNEEKPLLSPNVLTTKVFPLLDKGEKVFFLLIDNLRFDQWKIIESSLSDLLKVESEELYCSILPTATQYSRNAMFAGLMPLEINNIYNDVWLFDEDEGGKNLKEKELLEKQLARMGKNYKIRYEKVNNLKAGKKLLDSVSDLLEYDLNVIVYNFVDMLSHARTEMEMIRELANNESAYRSLTSSWFRHSHLLEVIRLLSKQNIKVIITTDHGAIRVNNAVRVLGDRQTSTNLRYKLGRNMDYNPKEVYEIKVPEEIHLPKPNISSKFIFATNDDFLVYPNNFNHFANYYRNTFQHGGISLEEMLIPIVTLSTLNYE